MATLKKSAHGASRNWMAGAGDPQLPVEPRATLEQWVRAPTTSQRLARRSRIVLLALDGLSDHEIAARIGVSTATVRLWRTRFEQQGPEVLRHDAPGRGRRPTMTTSAMRERLKLANLIGADGLPLSVRRAAAFLGVSPSAVSRAFKKERAAMKHVHHKALSS